MNLRWMFLDVILGYEKMYWLNKIIWFIANPAAIGCLMLCVWFVLLLRANEKHAMSRNISICMIGFSVLWFYVWSTALFSRIIGGALENEYLVNGKWPRVDDFFVCDIIADMGGGIGASSEQVNQVYLNSSADRAYFSALLWKAGKAPIIMPSGTGLVNADRKFLLDLGVPDSAIIVENQARNTEENAKLVGALVSERIQGHKPKVLIVTSAWHMKRTMLMFEKYAPLVDAIPAPCDFECAPIGAFRWTELLPSAEIFGRNSVYFHEWLGYWGYRLFR